MAPRATAATRVTVPHITTVIGFEMDIRFFVNLKFLRITHKFVSKIGPVGLPKSFKDSTGNPKGFT
jgi:hypothetical protein